MTKKIDSNYGPALFLAIACGSMVALCFILSSLLLIVGIPMNPYIFPVSLIGSMAIAGGVCGNNSGTVWRRRIILMLIIVAGSLLIAGLMMDYSPDGLDYHQEIIALICDGWNPYRSFLPEGPDAELTSIWALHYAKGIEIAEASIVSFTHNIESGKAVNIIMTVSAGSAIYDFIRRRFRDLKQRSVRLVTLAAVANPVIWEQIFTYYIDFYKYLYLLLLIIGMMELGSPEVAARRYGVIFTGIAVIMSVATKFNFFFECGLWGVAAVVWVIIRKEYGALRRLLVVGCTAFLIGILLNWHPYVTNYLTAGHPLYPLMGDNAVDIMNGNTTGMFAGYNRIINFFRTLLIPSIQIDCDQRNGGFTFLMPLILLLTVLIAVMGRRKIKGIVWYMAALCLLSCFLFEQTWWTRYICQLWFVPLVFLPSALMNRSTLWSGRCMGWLMILAGCYAALWSCKHEFVIGSYTYKLLKEAEREPIEIVGPLEPQIRYHISNPNIYFRVIDSLPSESELAGKKVLYYMEMRKPLIIISESRAEAIRGYLEKLHLNYDRHEYDFRTEKKDSDI